MANSRLEKIGTIYTRTKGLIDSGALKWIDRPLWYDLYEAFPPKEEPRFDREAFKKPIRNIFYEDDKIRALFHRNNKRLESQYQGEANAEKLYKEAIEMMSKERATRKEDDFISLSTEFKEAQNKDSKVTKVSLKNIFES
ncbi:Mitochondrial ribosomal protein S23 [Popillia japonica]|uniref:Small ribosomal subunit protein mS23 n=1 Tax=Popillia japonica TaxID=7064 RepID=A0AAW1M4Y5_POPJA